VYKLPGRFYTKRDPKESLTNPDQGYVRGRPVYGEGTIEWLSLDSLEENVDGSMDEAEANEWAPFIRQGNLASLKDQSPDVEWIPMCDEIPRAFYVNGNDIEALRNFRGKGSLSVYGMPLGMKRMWFGQEAERQRKIKDATEDTVHLRMHRGPRMLEDSQSYLHNFTVHKRLRVQIVNEDGTNETKIEDDAGGIHRAWISLVSDRLFDRETGLMEEYPYNYS